MCKKSVCGGGSRYGGCGMGNSFPSKKQTEDGGEAEREASNAGKGLEKITGGPI